ncbi:2-succinyl-5-enolpyruvyl-6-hydroxy-3-cyclohexene-1-carboxylic-acid synthase [Calothrix rhizosoleniae]|uniref:2-succinyl-5-enolpyruvyl-6-hydroxy-3- cyclohexene-1-carboxylic-acid synthase n=1 Tax=Calothrix rhizosoleniae TaxID=888997 RepID=UPI000B49D6A2|nr:2-succinyl-5-enolpyruvyl-6-hydroxy-3-cyclohexene-1-carboxylic-acid synthase [Calothrix rhizosoleniae]
MTTAYQNINQLWAAIAAQTLKYLGLKTAVICPGSRSTPLVVAFAQESPDIESISILDERSAAFFALGRAKTTGIPTVVVCTSGTAGANFYPAVIEAKESRVPLLLLTADRPPELRDCHSGQTIDQLKLYGNYPNWQTELAVPTADIKMLGYLRQIITYAWERSLAPIPGVVHLNVPFRDPLPPIPHQDQWQLQSLASLQSQLQPEEFFAGITNVTKLPITNFQLPILSEWQQCDRGIIIAGVEQPQQPQAYCRAIAQLAESLQFPILAEGLSPIRNHAEINHYVISTYDLILRNSLVAKQLKPQIVIQIGDMPTSKQLRQWLSGISARRWIIDSSYQNLDPLHGKTIHLRQGVEDCRIGEVGRKNRNFLQMWLSAETQVRNQVDKTLMGMEEISEVKLAWFLSQNLPPATPIFIANSMAVRDVEFFWKPNNLQIRPYFNRGANGIDGTLSTALGVAHRQQSSVMLTGDLALLHDTNGFLTRNKFVGHLTIILINNNGGGIFEMLPIAEFNPPFEEFFATPQDIDFTQLCATYGVEYELITSWQQLKNKLTILPSQGIRLLELQTNRQLDASWRQKNLSEFAQVISNK